MGGGQCAAFDQADAVGEETQRPLRGDLVVELAQRTGGAVARIRQHLAAVQAGVFVPAFEVGARHVDLAAHFQHRGPTGALQLLRDVRDGAQVRGHILAGSAIATRRALHEHAVLVAQADGEAVEFRLGGKDEILAIQPLADAAHEIADFRVAEGIAQRQHRHRVLDLREAAGRC